MQEFRFNYCIPREYKDKETGELKYCLCRGGEKMNVATLSNIKVYADKNKPKDAQPWIQIFNNGYRVTTDNINFKKNLIKYSPQKKSSNLAGIILKYPKKSPQGALKTTDKLQNFTL